MIKINFYLALLGVFLKIFFITCQPDYLIKNENSKSLELLQEKENNNHLNYELNENDLENNIPNLGQNSSRYLRKKHNQPQKYDILTIKKEMQPFEPSPPVPPMMMMHDQINEKLNHALHKTDSLNHIELPNKNQEAPTHKMANHHMHINNSKKGFEKTQAHHHIEFQPSKLNMNKQHHLVMGEHNQDFIHDHQHHDVSHGQHHHDMSHDQHHHHISQDQHQHDIFYDQYHQDISDDQHHDILYNKHHNNLSHDHHHNLHNYYDDFDNNVIPSKEYEYVPVPPSKGIEEKYVVVEGQNFSKKPKNYRNIYS